MAPGGYPRKRADRSPRRVALPAVLTAAAALLHAPFAAGARPAHINARGGPRPLHRQASYRQAGTSPGAPRIDNPGFERLSGARVADWEPYEAGYEIASDARHSGARSIRCTNRTEAARRGASYSITLNQTAPAPLLVTGWSRADGVSGGPDEGYSIYVDLEYRDGAPLWGQIAAFATGTHGWQRRQVLITPPKPLRSARIYALFRHHSGTAWFDDFSAMTLSGAVLFDSQALAPPRLPAGVTFGWFARDVAAGTPVLPLRTGSPADGAGSRRLRLRFIRPYIRSGGRITGGAIEDTSRQPRAVTIYYIERFPSRGAIWWDDLRSRAPLHGGGERANLTRIGAGATGSMSLYPFGCISDAKRGRAVGIPPSLGPRIARIGYNVGAGLLYLAFDLALTGENLANSDGRGHGRAEVAAARYDIDPAWGFRSAAAGFYRLFPDGFVRRAKAEGIWIPFTDPSTVARVGDFGIAYHEGDNSIAGDDRLGILSFRYTEPMTYWMPMPPDVPRAYADALALVRRDGAGANAERRRQAQAVLNSGSEDETGRFNVQFRNEPWANGAVWVLNPNPRLPHRPGEWTKAQLAYTVEMADRTYGPVHPGGESGGARHAGRATQGTSPGGPIERDTSRGGPGQDGEYLDSIEGWADVLDYRRESIRYARTPPTFATDSFRPVVSTWFSVYELADFMGRDLHRRGKLLMANSTPWRIHAFAPLLDVMGTETDWLPGGAWRPDSDAIFSLRRVLCYHKPYLLLQNTDFDRFGREQVERYFQRSMFYGVYPSMFSHNAADNPYWGTPRWYNRDRDLFRRYIPAIRRLSSAGWEPIPYARTDHRSVYVERFGTQYLTVLNDSTHRAHATLSIEARRFGLRPSGRVQVWDAVAGQKIAEISAHRKLRLSLDLKPEGARALRLIAVPGGSSPCLAADRRITQ